MGLKYYTAEVPAPATADKVADLQFTLDKNQGNCFRIKAIQIAVPNRDTVATGDKLGIQISEQAQAENSSLLDIDDADEIFTYQEVVQTLGTNGPRVEYEDRTKCFNVPMTSDIRLPTGKKLYLHALSTGQDGTDNNFIFKIQGQYEQSKDDPTDFNNNSLGD
jgi:hypothetical protein